MLSLLSLIVVLGVLVFVHELGHFVAAKWAGIRVFRFSIGMGPTIPGLRFVRGHTEYVVGWLPLGGYVKMASKEEMAEAALEGGADAEALADVPHEETYEAKPVWKRMIVILAGVTLNVAFAWVTFSAVLWNQGLPMSPVVTVGRVVDSAVPVGAEALRTLQPGDRITAVNGEPVTTWNEILDGIQNGPGDEITLAIEGRDPIRLQLPHDGLVERTRAATAVLPWIEPVLGQLQGGSPAEQAGLATGDTVVALDGVEVREWNDMVGVVEDKAGQPVVMTVGKPDGRVEVMLTPRGDPVTGPDGTEREVGKIGAWPLGNEPIYRPLALGEAVGEGGRMTLATSTLIVRIVRGMFSGLVSTRELGGPITIAQGAADSARRGLADFLMFMALISVNLAVVNLLPIPVLDGGQFLFLLGEAVIRKPLPLGLRKGLSLVGVMLIVGIMLLAISNDIIRLLGL